MLKTDLLRRDLQASVCAKYWQFQYKRIRRRRWGRRGGKDEEEKDEKKTVKLNVK